MNDCDVINFFVAYLRENGHPGLQVDRWPDKENRGTADIDAVAGHFAIEHTSVDTVPNQRRDSNWFKQVVDGLENAPQAFMGLLQGKNFGKLIIRVAKD